MTLQKLRAGVIGVGYLGQFHAEKYAKLPGVELAGIADADLVRAEQIARTLGTRPAADAAGLIGSVDVVSIVTPTVLHHRMAKQFLDAGVHVLLEKPMTVTLDEADELIALAAHRGVVLQIGHIERFNPAVTAIRPLLRSPRYLQAERSAPFTVRCTDVNVVLDLMIHDLDIVADLAGSRPAEVSSAGASIITRELDAVTARIRFENGCIADVSASRVSDEKKRLLRVFDGDAVYTADYQTQKAVRSRPTTGTVPELRPEALPTERKDTLFEEIADFVRCVREGRRPLVAGAEGRNALALATVITRSIEEGRPGFMPVR
jgi:predicted dehydrogenase